MELEELSVPLFGLISISGSYRMAPPKDSDSIWESNNGTDDVTANNEQKQYAWESPKAQGLYDPQNEHEACGVGFVVAIDGRRSHKVSTNSYYFIYNAIMLLNQYHHFYM